MRNVYNILTFIFLFMAPINAMESNIFVPTKETCGAAAGKKNVSDDIHSRIACMVAGYKNVYLGTSWQLEQLNDKEKELIASGVINQVLIKGNLIGDPLYGDILILYTPEGKKDASLLIKYLHQKITKRERLQRELENIKQNHYLVGTLLGYDKNDIEDFYFKISNFPLERFQQDKKQAEEFIAQN